MQGSTTYLQEAIKRIEKVRYYSLTSVDLNGLHLSELPHEIFQLKNIERLDLYNNKLSSLPVEITQLENLQSLDLSHNKFTTFPIEVTKLRNLQWLTLRNNYLNTLPTEITQLENLVWLDIVNNHLTAFPPEITQLSRLESLHCNHNPLSSIPTTITQLRYLRHLSLRDTLLQTLSTSITKLDTLQQLDLSYNQLTTLPAEIAQLNNLQRLNLSHNRLAILPKEICYFKKSLNLHGNYQTLTSPPVEIIRQGWNAVESYFQEIKKGKGKLYEAKLVFIGEERAGKTSLMKALLGEPFNAQENSTKGIEISSMTLSAEETGFEKDFCLNLWDFAGQEIYKDTHRFFLTKDTIYILVTENRKNTNDDNIHYWLNALNLFAPNAPVLLIQNKCDSTIEYLPFKKYQNEFNNLVNWSDLLHTSCVNGYENSIVELRQAIIRVLQDEHLMPRIRDDVPTNWVNIRHDLIKIQKSDQKTLSYSTFEELCIKRHKLENKQSVKILAHYFFCIGVFAHYADNSLLHRTIFLDNEWLTKTVYKVVDNATVKKKKGYFSLSDLEDMYSSTEYQGQEAEYIELMKKFNICYEVKNNQYLCPQCLPIEQPETLIWEEWQQVDSLHFIFNYQNFMPRGILSALVIDMHKEVCRDRLWQRGVVLKKISAKNTKRDETKALVHEGKNKEYLHIYICGQNKRDFLEIIKYVLEKIHQELNGLSPEFKLVCDCSQCIENPENPYSFQFDNIVMFLKKGVNEVQCQRSGENIKISKLTGYENISSQYITNYNYNIVHLNDNSTRRIYKRNEYQQNNGININISNSTIGGDVTIKDNQVHNQQVDVDTEALTAELEELIKQLKAKIANDEDNDNVYEAAKFAKKAHKELANGSQQTAIAVLQKGGRWFGEFANNVGANVVAGVILGALPQPR